MVGSFFLIKCSSLAGLARKTSRTVYHGLAAKLPGGILPANFLPAKFAPTTLQPSLPDERLSRARRAALLGVRRMPQGPGLWVRTSSDGKQRIYRVKALNGVLYAIVGRFAPMAVPTARLPGHWDHLD